LSRTLPIGALLTTLVVSPAVLAQVQAEADQDRVSQISPQLRINHPRNRDRPDRPPPRRFGARSIDGSENNMEFPEMGATETPLKRRMPSDYDDGISAMAGQDRPSPRAISNAVAAQGHRSIPNPVGASDFLWQWGQFIDHDIDLTDGAEPAEPADIPIPDGDPDFDPFETGTQKMAFNRSIYDPETGKDDRGNPREQLNEITAWIDASNVYGADTIRADALRAFGGRGRLKTSEGDLLPFNDAPVKEDRFPNAGGDDPTLFLAGDVRANEQVGLTALHTLFVRDHNWLADRIAEANPGMEGDEIYERARRIVGAEMQVITYKEYLPALLGPNAIPPYRGYNPRVDARIMNIFSTAAYRYGHSALSPTLLRLDARGNEIADGHLPLRHAFFAPQEIISHGIESVIRGLAGQKCQKIDPYLVDDVRNFLFGPPGSGGFDLASLNIQRGRDHGLPSYNDTRVAFGLPRAADFADVSSDTEIQGRLAAVYANVDDIDVWVGGLAEDPAPRGHVGKTMRRIIARQFKALRDGDRFWYTRILSPSQVLKVEKTRLSDIIRRNTEIGRELADDVFHVSPPRRR
jgi:peroxidase